MVESSNSQELLAKLQSEKDWHKSAIFSDKGDIITANKCIHIYHQALLTI